MSIRKSLLSVPLALSILGLAACGGSSGGGGAEGEAQIQGIWTGDLDGVDSFAESFVHDGRIMMHWQGGIVFDGAYEVTGGANIEGVFDRYSTDGSLSNSSPQDFSGPVSSFTVQQNPPRGVSLQFNNSYTLGADSELLEGTWTVDNQVATITVNEDGTFDGQYVTGCSFMALDVDQGIGILDEDINLYSIRFSLAGSCPEGSDAGEFTGFTTLRSNNTRLLVIAANGQRSVLLDFSR